MNTGDDISDELLQAWLDGEAGPDTARIEAYVNTHPEAMERVEEFSRAGQWLRHAVDGALGPVEPLEGMAAIRSKIREREESHWKRRLTSWWNDAWMFNRGAMVGVAFAAFAGVVAAPAVLWLMAEEANDIEVEGFAEAPDEGDLYAPAGIAIEQLEVEDGSARVLDAGETTLIWVDADDSDDWDEYEDTEDER